MFLPNRSNAYIPPEKLTAYLLSETHPVGKEKAQFFKAHGYAETNAELLALALLTIAQHQEVESKTDNAYGTNYVVDGLIQTPNGTSVAIQTVWFIETDDDKPRLITAYPK